MSDQLQSSFKVYKVIVFSIATGGYDKLFEKFILSHRQYCERYNYEYVLVKKSPRKLLATEASWLKVYLIKAALEVGYEWVLFIDADCEIRPHAPAFINEFNTVLDKSIFLAPGRSGRINAGVIFARNTTSAIRFFDQITSNADKKIPDEDSAAYENGHFIYFGKNSKDVFLLEHKLWNNNSNFDSQSYIQHYSGGPLRRAFNQKKANEEGLIITTLKKAKNKIKKIIPLFNSSKPTPIISKSLNDLLPYYLEKYPIFNKHI